MPTPDETDLDVYIRSMDILADLAPTLKFVHPSHNADLMDPALLPKMRDALIDVRDGKTPDRIDEDKATYDFDGFGIYASAPEGESLAPMVARVVAYMLAASVAVLTAGEIFQGGIITYTSVPAVLAFGLIVGLLNAFVKPVLQIVVAPLSCLTFGLISGALNFLDLRCRGGHRAGNRSEHLGRPGGHRADHGDQRRDLCDPRRTMTTRKRPRKVYKPLSGRVDLLRLSTCPLRSGSFRTRISSPVEGRASFLRRCSISFAVSTST